MAIIEVNHLTKEYQLGHLTSIKETALNALKRLTFQPVQERECFKALDDVNFHIEEGEVVGIIGHNGAGKSTLLKHLANISKPTKGEVIVRGSVAPLIEVGAGVNPELTGRENIFLNGAILGIPKKIIRQKLEEIIDFSELEQFIDTPVKRYSSGMTVKLGFSIATSMEADILIVDEVLAVGDLAFQRKCFDRMEDLINRQGKTVLLVSHNIRQVERLCNRVLLFDHGKKIVDGEPSLACNAFFEQSDEKIKLQTIHQQKLSKANSTISSTGEIELLDISILNADGQKIDRINYRSAVTIRIHFKTNVKLKDPTFGIGAHTPDLIFVANDDSILSISESVTIDPGEFTLEYIIPEIILLPGVYAIRVGAALKGNDRNLFYGENLYHFQVCSEKISRSRTVHQGFVSFGGNWIIHNT
ncbi:ABC transporter ATP-binding protein [Methylomonas montana]|uniref:ABC transporter ATP-binding protein n=1 Tax=Methylomonas montana TaxID=3058963 RepID=UPI00265A1A06|nr:ABC transporter ATP-binding protein [Methylomonas montana]WKJ88721.1 ABC transporter ATP-binding protein [Methylomonas montana]